MSIRTKRRRRLLLILLVLAVVIAGGRTLYGIRERAFVERAREAREFGLEAFRQGDYERAVRELGRYLRRLEPDPEALLRYAQAIRRLPSADAQALRAAAASLRRCVKLEPENAAARLALLDLFMELGVRTEANQQAEWLLRHDPSNAYALQAKIRILAKMRLYEEALRVLDERIHPDSPRLEEHLLGIVLVGILERPPEEILARAAAVERANASNPRYGLVGARARLVIGDVAGAKRVLESLAKLGKEDPEFARLLLPDLVSVGHPDEALALLDELEPQELDPGLRTELVRRLWESGRAAAIPQRIAEWRTDLTWLPTDVLGYGALAFERLGRDEEAEELTKILEERGDDLSARGWARLIRGVVLPDAPSVRRRIETCLAAIELDAWNAQSRFELGLAYRDAGEPELALKELEHARSESPIWPEPPAAAVSVLLQTRRFGDALRAAASAEAAQSEDPGVRVLASIARSVLDEPDRDSRVEKLLDGLDRLVLSAETTLPPKIAILLDAGRTAEAKALIREALSARGVLAADGLISCAVLSRAHALGLESQCLDKYERLHGSTPEVTILRAGLIADAGRADEGLALLRAKRRTAEGRPEAAWQSTEARFLEVHGSPPEALAAWRRVERLGGAKPALLLDVLDARSPWEDLSLVRRAIEQLRAATGESCLRWKLHTARLLLSDPEGGASRLEEATEHLRAVLGKAPKLVSARMLLARAYEERGRTREALGQLLRARDGLRPPPALDLEIARLHLKLGNRASARVVLDEFLATEPAVGVLPRLAELYISLGDFEKAWELVVQALEEGDSTEALLVGAALADHLQRPGDASALLDRLRSRTPDALTRERLLARHHRRVGRLSAARDHLLRVVDDADAELEDWLELLTVEVLLGRSGAVVDSLERAMDRGALGPSTQGPVLSPDLLRVAAERASLRRLGAAYLADATTRPVAEQALRLVASHDPLDASTSPLARLRRLAAAHPRFLALQIAVVDLLVGGGEIHHALTLCAEATRNFPGSPEPARALAYCYRRMERPDAAAEAAGEWRARIRGVPLAADLFLAEQSPPKLAASILEPYVASALRGSSPVVLQGYGGALIRAGETEQLESVLEPHIGDSPVAARAWAYLAGALAAAGEPERAVRWLGHGGLRAPAVDGPDLRIELAAAWASVGAAAGGPEAHDTSRTFLRDLEAVGPLSAEQGERVGLVHMANGNVEQAERAYRQAVEEDPDRLVALNNLAMILTRSGRAEKALPLAEMLLARAPEVALYRDTYLRVMSDLDPQEPTGERREE